jgi:hypothetical protein
MTLEALNNTAQIFSNPAWDVVAILFLIAAGFFYGLVSGRSRLISVLIATYTAAFLFENFILLNSLIETRGVWEAFLIRIASFLVILVLTSFIISKFIVFGDGGGKVWWKIFVLSFLQAGLVVSIILNFMPTEGVVEFSPLVEKVFAGDSALFWWLLAPLVALWAVI